MSCKLVWRQIRENTINVGDITLRDILREKFGFPHRLSHIDINYLEGLSDAMIEGAKELIKAIKKFDEIEIDIEC